MVSCSSNFQGIEAESRTVFLATLELSLQSKMDPGRFDLMCPYSYRLARHIDDHMIL